MWLFKAQTIMEVCYTCRFTWQM